MPRRVGVPTAAALSLCLSTLGCVPGPGQPSTSSGSIPSNGVIIAAGVAIGAVVVLIPTVILVDQHKRHTVKGCLISGPNGLQIQETQDAKNTYSLEGAPVDLKVGDLVRLHGNRGPKVKNGGVRTFKVTEIKKNFGACPAPASPSTNSH